MIARKSAIPPIIACAVALFLVGLPYSTGLMWHEGSCSGAQSSSYTISCYTIDSGGGSSSGGDFTVIGTAGQFDLGPVASGGSYSVSGGFWYSGIAVTDVPDDPDRKYANALFQNYPNPFRGGSGTTISYSLSQPGRVKVRIFDPAGRLVFNVEKAAQAGVNSMHWNGRGSQDRRLPSGLYLCHIETEQFVAHRKMLLVQ